MMPLLHRCCGWSCVRERKGKKVKRAGEKGEWSGVNTQGEGMAQKTRAGVSQFHMTFDSNKESAKDTHRSQWCGNTKRMPFHSKVKEAQVEQGM